MLRLANPQGIQQRGNVNHLRLSFKHKHDTRFRRQPYTGQATVDAIMIRLRRDPLAQRMPKVRVARLWEWVKGTQRREFFMCPQ
ncbi:hypothetical protein PlfCFBP13513_02180 [Plantibacter flavus]|nr:hypothetical protein PlfCFBP13513_02180 [Plantibacter flavus]